MVIDEAGNEAVGFAILKHRDVPGALQIAGGAGVAEGDADLGTRINMTRQAGEAGGEAGVIARIAAVVKRAVRLRQPLAVIRFVPHFEIMEIKRRRVARPQHIQAVIGGQRACAAERRPIADGPPVLAVHVGADGVAVARIAVKIGHVRRRFLGRAGAVIDGHERIRPDRRRGVRQCTGSGGEPQRRDFLIEVPFVRGAAAAEADHV